MGTERLGSPAVPSELGGVAAFKLLPVALVAAALLMLGGAGFAGAGPGQSRTDAPAAATPSQAIPPAAELPGYWQTYANADDILAMARDGDVLWVGTRSGGLVRWSLEDGAFHQYLRPQTPLGANTVYDIAIGPNGRKWIATDNGLSVLDDAGTPGRDDDVWRTYTRENTFGGLPSNDVRAIAVDGDTVWVGAHQVWRPAEGGWVYGGLGRLDTKGTPRTDDDTWAAVATFDDTQGRAHDGSAVLGLVSDNVNDVVVAAGGHVWIATAPQRRLERPPNPDKPREWQQAHGGLSHLIVNPDSLLPFGDWTAFSCEAPLQDETGRPLIACDSRQLALDADNRLWVAGGGLGAVSLPATARVITAFGVIRFDKAGTQDLGFVDAVAPGVGPGEVWLGLRTRGLARLRHGGTLRNKDDDEWALMSTAQGLPRDRVQCLLAADSGVWAGTGPDRGVGGGVAAVDGETLSLNGTLQTSGVGNVPPTNFLTDVAVGPEGSSWEGHVWLATGSRSQRLFGRGVIDLDTQGTGDRQDDALTTYTSIGTDDDGEPPYTGLAGDNVRSLAITTGRVWVGSAQANWDVAAGRYADGGLAAFDGDQWTAWPVPVPTGEPPGVTVSTVAQGCEGRMWVGTGGAWTKGEGALEADVGGATVPTTTTWTRFGFPELASDEVDDIAADCADDTVWVASPHHSLNGDWSAGGVAVRRGGQWSHYDEESGLESYSAGRIKGEGLSLAIGGGAVWVGTYGTRATTEANLVSSSPYWPAVVNRFASDQWEHWVFDGLGRIDDLAIDPQGRVWAADSRAGMARDSVSPEGWVEDYHLVGLLLWDGAAWTSLGLAQGLPSNDITGIAAGADGSIWVVTEGRGFAQYRPEGPSPTPTATNDAPSPTPTFTPSPTATRTPGTPGTPGEETPTGSPATPTLTTTAGTPTGATPGTPTRTPGPWDHFIYAPSVHQSRPDQNT